MLFMAPVDWFLIIMYVPVLVIMVCGVGDTQAAALLGVWPLAIQVPVPVQTNLSRVVQAVCVNDNKAIVTRIHDLVPECPKTDFMMFGGCIWIIELAQRCPHW